MEIKYDDNEPITHYLRRVEEFKRNLIKNKYDLLLNLINDILKLSNEHRFLSLTDIKNIPESEFKNKEDILENHKENINKNFTFQIKKQMIIIVLKKLLSESGYKLIEKDIKSNIYYSIILI